MSEKTCRTCAHRSGTLTFGRCMRTGCYIETQRNYPSTRDCDVRFSGWEQRSGLLARIRQWFLGVKS